MDSITLTGPNRPMMSNLNYSNLASILGNRTFGKLDPIITMDPVEHSVCMFVLTELTEHRQKYFIDAKINYV